MVQYSPFCENADRVMDKGGAKVWVRVLKSFMCSNPGLEGSDTQHWAMLRGLEGGSGHGRHTLKGSLPLPVSWLCHVTDFAPVSTMPAMSSQVQAMVPIDHRLKSSKPRTGKPTKQQQKPSLPSVISTSGISPCQNSNLRELLHLTGPGPGPCFPSLT